MICQSNGVPGAVIFQVTARFIVGLHRVKINDLLAKWSKQLTEDKTVNEGLVNKAIYLELSSLQNNRSFSEHLGAVREFVGVKEYYPFLHLFLKDILPGNPLQNAEIIIQNKAREPLFEVGDFITIGEPNLWKKASAFEILSLRKLARV